jgi:murein DD-endopeptidase MepM/ murein hydrolase activator NlpD
MNIEKKILEIYEEINNSKKSLREAALEAPLDSVSVNSPFGSRWGGQHNGVDLAANAAEVKAPADGVVAKVADDEPPCGGTIVIDHADGYRTGFCHMQKINVKSGQEVKQGDVIGISGGGPNDPGRGKSDGRHLHFTLRKDGKLLNPMDYINKDSVVMSGDSPKSSSDDSSGMSDSEKAYAAATGVSSKKDSKTSYGQIIQNLKSLSGLNEMFSTKEDFKSFLMNEVANNSDELLGGASVTIPIAGAHKGQTGWHSNNAWDIMSDIGTPVYAIADGIVGKFHDYGDKVIERDGKRLFGQSFTVKSDNNLPSVYYTHLKDSPVKEGDKISCGQYIGSVMDFPNSDADHVHIGVETGDISQFLNSNGTLKCSKGEKSSDSSSKKDTSSISKSVSFDQNLSVNKPVKDDFVYNIAKKIGDLFLPKNESRQIEEQKNFGRGVQNRFGRIIIPGDLNSKIKSPISGVVDNSRYSSSCKNQITIKNEDNDKVYLEFCGIDTPLVRNGSLVSEGQIIGKTDSDVDVTFYNSSWNRIHIGDNFEVKKPKHKDTETNKKTNKYGDNDNKKSEKERYYSDPAVALMASLPGMAFDKIFGNRYDEKTGELKQKRWGGVADKRPVDPWVIDAIKKPFTKKVNEDIEKIKRLLK